MKLFFRACLIPIVLVVAVATLAQGPIPQAAFAEKTIAVVNDTKTGDVSDGALEQLKGWGHFIVVDDADSADIVLRFDKKTDREKQNSQSTDEKGTTTWSGGDDLFVPGAHACLSEGIELAVLHYANRRIEEEGRCRCKLRDKFPEGMDRGAVNQIRIGMRT